MSYLEDLICKNRIFKSKKDLKMICGYHECRKRLKLLHFECKCGLKLCKDHRLAHSCNYDYKKEGIKLEGCKNNKIEKI